ncbi:MULTISPECIES: glycoside hydrolase family 16 protein [unclassified Lysobacter]|uniref:glycoside hydrolase family 16 protein n=1 Tax=unclassified Lysobacter TaxID=2635362 RepID=UPI001BE5F2C2|nr:MULTISPECIES: glycoside hydrolase family 16 protein [unclassified Lysobacter]MBT2744951.1 glycoside hydrolase family 16 protein [Lysobacter sp. ISL-42]MBT2752056.1 glycoside hydrolase family 16 protein [Lysobacter sp. ISL-50]MBT2778553.1 glycoside hydrolase family 16 protein [Lysobacter sp. ISL-54]MBT2780516.1 glycoside hydrolase family 16 protein [Lysobacter sp. ISL-52]
MNVSRAYTLAAAALIAGGSLMVSSDASAQTLVWEDNFNGPSIDGNKWIYDVGDGCQLGICGWGNSELQYYTSRPENARIENGNLVIEARRENFGSRAFTSARLKTEGRMHFKYGTLEARIKVPDLRNGLWPAYWMLGTIGNWPARGEIDMLEMGSAAAIAAGVTNRRVAAAVHWDYNGSQADYGLDYNSASDLNGGFHTYRMTWDPQFIRVSIDGQQYFEFAISNIEGASLHEFHQQYYLLLNLAVGGSYTGVMSNDAITAPLPGKMEIDYIRLYQNPGSELYTGANPPSGKFGVYTERADMNARLNYNGDANLWLWNNLTPISAPAFEGNQLMAYRANAGAWYGLGVALNGYKNMSLFGNGRLKFHMRTTTPSTFKIGINSSFGDSWLDFVNGGQQYGLVRDGNWHEVSIPFSAFHDLDLRAVKQMFMVVSDPPAANVDVLIDNVYYQDN